MQLVKSVSDVKQDMQSSWKLLALFCLWETDNDHAEIGEMDFMSDIVCFHDCSLYSIGWWLY
jgi:hypothetical protein